MSLIPCAENCRHQQDGYCMLEEAKSATNKQTNSGCCYFEPKTKANQNKNKNNR